MIKQFFSAVVSAWYEFLYQFTGEIEYAKVPKFRPQPKPKHPLSQIGMRNPANYRYERIQILCTNPDFQEFLLGHAKECLDMLAHDPNIQGSELPTYPEMLKKKCGEAVIWTLRMLPYSTAQLTDIDKLKEDVVEKVLHSRYQ